MFALWGNARQNNSESLLAFLISLRPERKDGPGGGHRGHAWPAVGLECRMTSAGHRDNVRAWCWLHHVPLGFSIEPCRPPTEATFWLSFRIFSRPKPLLRPLSEQIVIPCASQYHFFRIGAFEVFGKYA